MLHVWITTFQRLKFQVREIPPVFWPEPPRVFFVSNFHAEPGELHGSRSQASAPRPPGARGVSGAGGRAASARPARRSRWPRRPSRGPHSKWRTCGAPRSGAEREVGLQWPETGKNLGGVAVNGKEIYEMEGFSIVWPAKNWETLGYNMMDTYHQRWCLPAGNQMWLAGKSFINGGFQFEKTLLCYRTVVEGTYRWTPISHGSSP